MILSVGMASIRPVPVTPMVLSRRNSRFSGTGSVLKALVGMVMVGYWRAYFSPSGNCIGRPLSIEPISFHTMLICFSSIGDRKGSCAMVCGMPVTSEMYGPSLLPAYVG